MLRGYHTSGVLKLALTKIRNDRRHTRGHTIRHRPARYRLKQSSRRICLKSRIETETVGVGRLPVEPTRRRIATLIRRASACSIGDIAFARSTSHGGPPEKATQRYSAYFFKAHWLASPCLFLVARDVEHRARPRDGLAFIPRSAALASLVRRARQQRTVRLCPAPFAEYPTWDGPSSIHTACRDSGRRT